MTLLQQAPTRPRPAVDPAGALSDALSTFLSILNRKSHGVAGQGEPMRRLMALRVFVLWDAATLHQALSPDLQRRSALGPDEAHRALEQYRRDLMAVGADVATFDKFHSLLGSDVPWSVALDRACVPAAVSRFVVWRMMPWDHGRLAQAIGDAATGAPLAHHQALVALAEARAAQQEVWAANGPDRPKGAVNAHTG